MHRLRSTGVLVVVTMPMTSSAENSFASTRPERYTMLATTISMTPRAFMTNATPSASWCGSRLNLATA